MPQTCNSVLGHYIKWTEQVMIKIIIIIIIIIIISIDNFNYHKTATIKGWHIIRREVAWLVATTTCIPI